MFNVFAAHADESAVLMFNTGPVCGEAISSYQGESLYHASLDAAEYERLLHQHGFDVVAHAVEDPQADERTVWLARRAASNPQLRPHPARSCRDRPKVSLK